MRPARLRSPIPQELVSSQWDNRSSACAQPDTCVVRLAVKSLSLVCTRDDEITPSSISQSFLRRSGPTDPSICMCTCAAFPTVCQACARASQCTVQPCIYVRVALRSIHPGWVRPGVAKLEQENGAALGLAEINHHLQSPLGGSEGSRPGSSQPPLPSLPALVLPPSASLPPSPPSPSPPPPLPRRHRRHSRHGHRLRFRCAQRSVRCASGAR